MDRNRKDHNKPSKMTYWQEVGMNLLTGTLVVGFFVLVFSGTAEAGYYNSSPVAEMSGTELFRLIVAALREVL